MRSTLTYRRSARLSTTRAAFSMAARLMTTSTAPAAPRRTRRLTYADADRVYGGGSAAATSAHWSAPGEQPAAVRRDGVGTASLRSRVEQRWLTALLGLMRTPYVGVLAERLLELGAYAAYTTGSITLFTRRRVGPPVTATAASGPPLQCATDGLLGAHALDCLYVGPSPIHSRGVFTARALPRGTRVIAEPRRSLLLAPHFLLLLADTHAKLPDTWHYAQPTGSVVELVTQAQPHHLMNHSCAANVCSGLSHTFWEAAAIVHERQRQQRSADGGGGADWGERLTRWPCFADANSLFLTRDVEAGEELTLNYSARMAPLHAGEATHATPSRSWLLCRCGQPNCRHYVYRPTAEVSAVLHALRTQRPRRQGSAASVAATAGGGGAVPPRTPDLDTPLHVMAALLERGIDDELVLLSYAGTSADIVAYLYGQPLPSLRGPARPATAAASESVADALPTTHTGIDVEVRRMSKRALLADYRHVFRLLNDAVPAPPCGPP